MAHPYMLKTSKLKRPPVKTALFDFFKTGPGPSSSHTIGPMKAGADFAQRCASLSDEVLSQAAGVHVALLGSLSATGKGHGTDVAVLAGLLGHAPSSCPPSVLPALMADPAAGHAMRIGDREIAVGLQDIEFGPLQHDAPYSNTLRMSLCDSGGKGLFDMEYYSVGGGFIQWKGYVPPERGKLPGTLGVWRKAHGLLERTRSHTMPIGRGMGLLNAYAFAVAEENAAGGLAVSMVEC